jgi:hypothetical protein
MCLLTVGHQSACCLAHSSASILLTHLPAFLPIGILFSYSTTCLCDHRFARSSSPMSGCLPIQRAVFLFMCLFATRSFLYAFPSICLLAMLPTHLPANHATHPSACQYMLSAHPSACLPCCPPNPSVFCHAESLSPCILPFKYFLAGHTYGCLSIFLLRPDH